MMQRYGWGIVISWLLMSAAVAQPTRPWQGAVEVGGLSAFGNQTPYWLRTNQYGTVPQTGNVATVRAEWQRDYRRDSTTRKQPRRVDWGAGLRAVLNVGSPHTTYDPALLLPDAYLKVRLSGLELYAGNRREVVGIGDTLLTSGFMAWSGNAMPFPKVQLHTPNYIPIGFTKGWLAVRAGYAHGWLINTYIQGSYLHQKYLYGRLGKPGGRWHVAGGINHQVQWAGQANYLRGTDLAVDGRLPSAFSDYLSMITGRYPDALQNDRFTGFDGTNRIGNHLGTYDLSVDYRSRRASWLLYHQHYYEDASGLALQNLPDGLTGLRWQRGTGSRARFQLQRVLVEWLTTMNQSGSQFDPAARYQGADNYFDHSQYREGWSYRGKTLGTPLIAPRGTFVTSINDTYTGGGYFPNNRLSAWHAGLIGAFRKGPVLTLRLTYSRNYGTYIQPYPAPFRQFSGAASARWALPKRPDVSLLATLAVDRGELYPNSVGSFLSLQKRW
ncbi:capsule assembly Wzi family protein [Spirosoma luteolum]